MRRYWREPRPAGMFRSAEFPRLLVGLAMLAVLYMLIDRARDQRTWRWLTAESHNAAPVAPARQPPRPVTPLPAAAGPTDEDPEQAAAAAEEYQALTDGTANLGPEEMEIYDRLVEWVKNQSFDRLYSRAKKGLRYTYLYDDAPRRRGELVALDLEVRIAGDAGKNRYGVPLHDAWAVAADGSTDRLYSLIVVDYPQGMPLGYDIRARAKFAGYFMKLQGYHPALTRPGQPPEKAPLLIGRLQWTPPLAADRQDDSLQEWLWGLGLLAALGAAFGIKWMYNRWHRPPKRPAAEAGIPYAADGEVIPIEKWLEQAAFDGAADQTDEN